MIPIMKISYNDRKGICGWNITDSNEIQQILDLLKSFQNLKDDKNIERNICIGKSE